MLYLVDFQQHKYIDRSDNPPLRTWKIKADSPERAFEAGQRRAVSAYAEKRYLSVKRVMRDEQGELYTADGDYLPEYSAILFYV